jgi:hypothetical protein
VAESHHPSADIKNTWRCNYTALYIFVVWYRENFTLKCKSKVVCMPKHHSMKMYGEMDVKMYAF